MRHEGRGLDLSSGRWDVVISAQLLRAQLNIEENPNVSIVMINVITMIRLTSDIKWPAIVVRDNAYLRNNFYFHVKFNDQTL